MRFLKILIVMFCVFIVLYELHLLNTKFVFNLLITKPVIKIKFIFIASIRKWTLLHNNKKKTYAALK